MIYKFGRLFRMKHHHDSLSQLQSLHALLPLLLLILLHLLTFATAQTGSSTPLQVEINGARMEETMDLDDDSSFQDIDGRPTSSTLAEDSIMIQMDSTVPIRNATVHAPEGARCFFWMSDYVPDGDDDDDADAATDVSLDRSDLAPLVRLANGRLVGTHKSPVFGRGENVPSTLSFADDDEHTYDLLICYHAKDDDVVVFFQQMDGDDDNNQSLTVVRVTPDWDRSISLRHRALFDVLQASIIESPDPAMTCELGEIPEITRQVDPGRTEFVSIRLGQPSEEMIRKVDFVDCAGERD